MNKKRRRKRHNFLWYDKYYILKIGGEPRNGNKKKNFLTYGTNDNESEASILQRAKKDLLKYGRKLHVISIRRKYYR